MIAARVTTKLKAAVKLLRSARGLCLMSDEDDRSEDESCILTMVHPLKFEFCSC
jgi:hypothetical protein